MRLIDADEEIKFANENLPDAHAGVITAFLRDCATIDPEKLRPKGKWIWNPNGMDWGLGAWECSECACINNNLPMSRNMNPLMFSGSKYCPNCGAKMEG